MSDQLFPDGDAPPAIDETKNYLEELVGEGKKYKDIESLAKAYINADNHIKKVESEQKELREELKVRTTLEEFLDQMKSRETEGSNRNTNTEEKPDDSASEQKLKELLETTLSQRESQFSKDRNIQTVKETLEKHWGPGYQVMLDSKTRELGLGKEFVTGLAQTQPQALFKLFDVAPSRQEPELRSRTSGPPSPDSGTKNYAYYQAILKKDKNLYFTPSIQNEMFKKAQEMGDSFYT